MSREEDQTEDWDAEVASQPLRSAPSATSMITELAAGNKGVVTITPAGHKSRQRVPPVDVRVDWLYPGNDVELYTSYDDFQNPCILGPAIDEESGEEFHTGVLQVPPGRYLVRYKVDGEWLIDDNQEVVYSLGNEYNALTVRDPEAGEDEFAESDDDWDDIDDQLPEEFEQGGDAAKELLNMIPASASGMVTISPAAILQMKEQMSAQEKSKLLGQEAAQPKEAPSLAWDAQRGGFVIEPADEEEEDESEADKPAAAAGGDLSHSTTAPEIRKIREKERRKARRKKKQERRRQGDGHGRGRATSGASKLPDITLIKDEVVKREREWREAWILHELKTQELREKEKATLRQQWKEEREQWINKIKHYADDANALRAKLNEVQTRLEQAESGKELVESASKRKAEALEAENIRLNAESEKSKKEIQALRESVRTVRAEYEALQNAFETAKTDFRQQSSDITSKESHARLALETAQRDLQGAQDALAQAKADFEKRLQEQAQSATASSAAKAEFEAKLAEVTSQLNTKWSTDVKALKDHESRLTRDLEESQSKLAVAIAETKKAEDEIKARRTEFETELNKLKEELKQQTAAIAKDSQSVQSQLNDRLTALTAETAAKDKALEDLREELKNVQKQLVEAQRVSGTVQKQLESEQARAAAAEAKATQSETEKQATAAQLGKHVEELTAQIASQSKSLEAEKSELSNVQAALAEAKRNAASLQAAIDSSKADVESAKKDNERSAEQIKTLTVRVETLTAERAKAEAESDKKIAEAEGQISTLRGEITSTKATLDSVRGEIDKLNSDAKVKEANWAREKSTLEAEIERTKSGKDALLQRVNAVVASAKAVRDNVEGFKEDNLRQFSLFKNEVEDNKSFLLNSINAQSQLLATTMKKYKKEMSERRKYFNLVQELKGNIRVFCRSRPVTAKDEAKGTKSCVNFPDEGTIVLKTEKRQNDYEFDRVFGPTANNAEVFRDISALVTSCMDGYNVCIFAYGQTGSGKTWTMSGIPEDPGVNTRALHELFRLRDERSHDFRYKISVSFLEIYNETVKDLLEADKGADKPLKIHKGPNGMYIDNLAEWEVTSPEDVHKAMDVGAKNRSVGVTNMNEHSSRSHSLLSVRVVGQNLTAGITYYGKLHLIDLAGSERISKSQATGQRLKEAQAINKSLSALGNVIEALQHKNAHVPYRDSKLTFLLQDSLGGHAKTLMFINVSPTEDDSEESFCSLNFASRVRKVELGGAARNVAGGAPGAAPPAGGDSEDYVTDSLPADNNDDDMVDDTASAADEESKRPAAPAAAAGAKKPVVATKPVVASIKRPGTTATPIKKPVAPVKR